MLIGCCMPWRAEALGFHLDLGQHRSALPQKVSTLLGSSFSASHSDQHTEKLRLIPLNAVTGCQEETSQVPEVIKMQSSRRVSLGVSRANSVSLLCRF